MVRQMFEMNDEVRSLRDPKIYGFIIGFGTLQWNDGENQVPVYLVMTDSQRSDSPHGPVVRVLRYDQVVGRFAPENDDGWIKS